MGQRREEVGEACLNHLKPFKRLHRLIIFLNSTRTLRKSEVFSPIYGENIFAS